MKGGVEGLKKEGDGYILSSAWYSVMSRDYRL